jgi:hypothetical protein
MCGALVRRGVLTGANGVGHLTLLFRQQWLAGWPVEGGGGPSFVFLQKGRDGPLLAREERFLFFFLFSSSGCPRRERGFRRCAMATERNPFRADRNAFWVSYEPAEGETVKDFKGFLKRVFPGRKGFWGVETTRDGHRVFDFLLCLQSRTRVESVCGQNKWARKGARGRLVGLQWPKEGVTCSAFVALWATRLRRRHGTEFGCLRDVEETAEGILQSDRARRVSRKRRGRGLPSSSTVLLPSKAPRVSVSSSPSSQRSSFSSGTEGAGGGGRGTVDSVQLAEVVGAPLSLSSWNVVGCPAVSVDFFVPWSFFEPLSLVGSPLSEGSWCGGDVLDGCVGPGCVCSSLDFTLPSVGPVVPSGKLLVFLLSCSFCVADWCLCSLRR